MMDGLVMARCAYSVLLLVVIFFPPAFIINTTSRNSPLRILWVPVLVFTSTHLLAYMQEFFVSTVPKTVVTGFIGTVMIQCLNHLVITAHDAQSLQGAIHHASDSSTTKLIATCWLFFNLRGWKTPWQVKNIPPFPRFYNLGPHDSGPNKGWFVFRGLLIMSWQYLFMEVFEALGNETPLEEKARNYGPGTEYAFRSATREQVVARVITTLMFMPPARVSIDLVYRTVGMILIIPGFLEPGDWPPLFGNLWESYTLRGFWNSYWHQLCRSPLISISNYITRDLLRLRRPSITERYLNISLVALFSGIGHLIQDVFSGVPASQSDWLFFFSSLAIGIMIEDGAQNLLRLLSGDDHQGGNDKAETKDTRVPLWRRFIGFVWVVSWFCMTAPVFLYPILRRELEGNKSAAPIVVSWIGMPTAQAIVGIGGLVLMFGVGGEI